MSTIKAIEDIGDALKPHVDNRYFTLSNVRYLATLKLMPFVNKDTRVLDIGSGYGHLSILIKNKFGCDMYALDHHSKIATKFNSYGIHFNLCDLVVDNLPYEDNYFDIVLNCELIEHLFTFPQRLLCEIRRVLKPNGKVIITTPNLYSLTKRIRFLMGKRIIERLSIMKDKPIPLECLGDCSQVHSLMQSRLFIRHNFGGTHMREYDMDEIKALLNETGFKVIKAIYPTNPIVYSGDGKKYDLNLAHMVFNLLTNAYKPWRNQIIISGEKAWL